MKVKKSNQYWMIKSDRETKRILDELRLERIRNNKDKEMRSYNRMIKALLRHPKALADVKIADFVEDENE